MSQRPRITDLGREDFRHLAAEYGLQPYRGEQVFRWVHGRGVCHAEGMSDLPKAFRSWLEERYEMALPEARWERDPASQTEKILLPVRGGDVVEAVLIMEGDRTTTCLSTQVGCPVGCRFCASGLLGLRRNLTRGEILDQFHVLRARAVELGRRVSNVVMMGMGEPMLNYDATLGALDVLHDEKGGGIGARHLTISTIGLRKGIERLKAEGRQYTLAISLHAPDDALRARLIPFGGGMKVAELVDAARDYLQDTGREVTFEYVMLEGVNAAPEQAQQLAQRLAGVQATVNLIPYNVNPGLPYATPAPRTVDAFASILRRRHVKVSVRRRKGHDILAACGQLRLQDLEARRDPA